MQPLNNIPDNAVVVLQGSQIKELLNGFQQSITREIANLGNPARWVKSKEACEVLGCSKSSLNRLVKDGKLNPSRDNRDLTFCLAELIQYKRNQQINPRL